MSKIAKNLWYWIRALSYIWIPSIYLLIFWNQSMYYGELVPDSFSADESFIMAIALGGACGGIMCLMVGSIIWKCCEVLINKIISSSLSPADQEVQEDE